MKRALRRTDAGALYYFVSGDKISGANPRMEGDVTGLWGDCSGLRGDCSGLEGDCSGLEGDCSGLEGDCSGLRGDVTGLRGDVSRLWGDVTHCAITAADRSNGIAVADLIADADEDDDARSLDLCDVIPVADPTADAGEG